MQTKCKQNTNKMQTKCKQKYKQNTNKIQTKCKQNANKYKQNTDIHLNCNIYKHPSTTNCPETHQQQILKIHLHQDRAAFSTISIPPRTVTTTQLIKKLMHKQQPQ